MLLLSHQDAKRWFTLTVDQKTGFPCIKIRRDVLEKINPMFHQRMVDAYLKQFGWNKEQFPFTLQPGDAFGFSDCLRRISADDDWVTYRLELPVVHQFTQEPCEECGGKKEDEFGSTCFHCSGKGKRSEIHWNPIHALSASLEILLTPLLWAREVEPQPAGDGDIKQLLTLQLAVQVGMHGGSLGGNFSPHFINHLKTFGEHWSWDDEAKVMLRVYQHMWQGDKVYYLTHSIRAWQNTPGNLILDVPGNATGVHPSPYVHTIREGEGVEYTCHNVDTALQQLTLVTGLAAMCDLVDRATQ